MKLNKLAKNTFLKNLQYTKRVYSKDDNTTKLKNLANKMKLKPKDNILSRILTNSSKEEDLQFDYSEESVGFWINKVAREGPKSVTLGLEVPEPVIVTVTGAAGAIGYALLPRIAAGDMLGPDQPIILNLLEKEDQLKALEGVVMELKDCAFPLLRDIRATSSPKEAFFKADYALLVGSKPRLKGMERSDVLKDNAAIFSEQGKAINDYAHPDIKVLVVGNPANTNAMITSSNAPDVDPKNITAMTRLDHDRGVHQIAAKAGCKVSEIDRFCIWGNHSATQYPDVSNTLINGKWLRNVIKDEDWIWKEFIPRVQQRGAEIINVRGKSSAASAAGAAIAHMRDWILGSPKWNSMAVPSVGLYGIPAGIWASIPVVLPGAGIYEPIEVQFDEESAKRINASINELLQERELVSNLLAKPKFRLTEYNPKEIFSWKWHKETIASQYIGSIITDHSSTSFIKQKFLEKADQSKELVWRQLTKSFLTENSKNLDLSSLEGKYSKKDIEQLVDVTIRMIEADVELLNRKYLKLTGDLKEINLFGDNVYNNLKSAEEKRNYLLDSLLRDGKLSEEGLNTKKLIADQVKLLVN